MISIALYQPDIPQNVGAMIRLCACTGAGLEIIEPCSFPWNERKIRQSAMDYMTKINYARRPSWQDFCDHTAGRRVVLMTTKASEPYTAFRFRDHDILLAGSESAGVPDFVHDSADARVTIPMQAGLRSLNIVNASAMILGEAMRQTQWSAA